MIVSSTFCLFVAPECLANFSQNRDNIFIYPWGVYLLEVAPQQVIPEPDKALVVVTAGALEVIGMEVPF